MTFLRPVAPSALLRSALILYAVHSIGAVDSMAFHALCAERSIGQSQQSSRATGHTPFPFVDSPFLSHRVSVFRDSAGP
jgi:hypothetical protein